MAHNALSMLADFGTGLWMVSGAVFFVLSIVVGIVQHVRKRELWDAPGLALGVLGVCWAVLAVGGLGYAVAGRFGSIIAIPAFLFFGGALLLGIGRRLMSRLLKGG